MAKLKSVVTEQGQDWSFDRSNGKTEIGVGHSGRNDKNPCLNDPFSYFYYLPFNQSFIFNATYLGLKMHLPSKEEEF